MLAAERGTDPEKELMCLAGVLVVHSRHRSRLMGGQPRGARLAPGRSPVGGRKVLAFGT
jgi:hypothetical protein